MVVLWRSCNTFVDKFSFPRLIKEINFFTDRPMKMWHVAKTEPHSFFSLHPHVSDQPQPPLPSYQTRPPPPAMDSVRWSTTQESLQALLFNMQFPWFFFPIRLTISDSFKKPQILFLYINLIKPIVVQLSYANSETPCWTKTHSLLSQTRPPILLRLPLRTQSSTNLTGTRLEGDGRT